ncbi:MAG: VWA domain-containing protein [Planctomycetaceae bacterium]|jgi:Ca-activated chloride channel family protein|nr:VWA domain-containing protein [Planctomycetaceae bacterium]
MFRFYSPYYFLFLAPFFVFIFFVEYRRRRVGVIFSSVAMFSGLPVTFMQRVGGLLPVLFYIGVFLIIVALARPQSGIEEYRVRADGIAIAMCVDRSGSMEAEDFEVGGKVVNRLAAVKKVFRDFVCGNGGKLGGRKDDMIGLIAFGGYVDAFCPLTFDHSTLLEMLDQVNLLVAPKSLRSGADVRRLSRTFEEENMTAIGDTIAIACDRLKDVKAKSKVIILLSDGMQNFGELDPLEAAEIAKTLGIKIYTIGIGAGIASNANGRNIFTMASTSMVDETMLRKIVEISGGKFYSANSTDALEQVYAEIDKLEKTTHEGRIYTQYKELYRYPLIIGATMILAHFILINTRFRRLP